MDTLTKCKVKNEMDKFEGSRETRINCRNVDRKTVNKSNNVGDKSKFDGIESRFLCQICGSILISPIQTECGCRFCKPCHASSNIVDSDSNCLFCQDQISDPSIINTDKAIEKELRAMKFELTYDKIKKVQMDKLEIIDKRVKESTEQIKKLKKEISSEQSENQHLNYKLNKFEQSSTLINNDDESIYWIINDIQNKIYRVKSNRNLNPVIISKSCYLKKPGYKVSFKIHLVGDGSGANTHLSIFFRIHSGEFDEGLKWPFVNKMLIEVIGDNNNTVSHVLKTDAKSPQYQKPLKNSINGAVGQPKLISLEDILNGSKYLNNDSLLVRISCID